MTKHAGTCDEATAGYAALAGSKLKIRGTKNLKVEISSAVDTALFRVAGDLMVNCIPGKPEVANTSPILRPASAQLRLNTSARMTR